MVEFPRQPKHVEFTRTAVTAAQMQGLCPFEGADIITALLELGPAAPTT